MEYNRHHSMSDLEALQIMRLQCQKKGQAGVPTGLRAAKERGLQALRGLDILLVEVMRDSGPHENGV